MPLLIHRMYTYSHIGIMGMYIVQSALETRKTVCVAASARVHVVQRSRLLLVLFQLLLLLFFST